MIALSRRFCVKHSISRMYGATTHRLAKSRPTSVPIIAPAAAVARCHSPTPPHPSPPIHYTLRLRRDDAPFVFTANRLCNHRFTSFVLSPPAAAGLSRVFTIHVRYILVLVLFEKVARDCISVLHPATSIWRLMTCSKLSL